MPRPLRPLGYYGNDGQPSRSGFALFEHELGDMSVDLLGRIHGKLGLLSHSARKPSKFFI